MIADKVKECVSEYNSCRGCIYSYDPQLFDGGCILHYEGMEAKERIDAKYRRKQEEKKAV